MYQNTSYHFQVKAKCSSAPSDTSDWSALAIFTTLNDVGFNDISMDFNIFPNPVNSGFLRIELATNKFKSIEMVDITGHSIIQVQVNNQSVLNFNLSDFSSGVYFIKFITTENEIFMRKLIKN